MHRVECQVCRKMVGKGPDGLGIISHSKMHRRQFERVYDRKPRDYDEVIEKLDIGPDHEQAGFEEIGIA